MTMVMYGYPCHVSLNLDLSCYPCVLESFLVCCFIFFQEIDRVRSNSKRQKRRFNNHKNQLLKSVQNSAGTETCKSKTGSPHGIIETFFCLAYHFYPGNLPFNNSSKSQGNVLNTCHVLIFAIILWDNNIFILGTRYKVVK